MIYYIMDYTGFGKFLGYGDFKFQYLSNLYKSIQIHGLKMVQVQYCISNYIYFTFL